MDVAEQAAMADLIQKYGVKKAAELMGVSVSYVLTANPDARTEAQKEFDAREHRYLEPTGYVRGRRREWWNR